MTASVVFIQGGGPAAHDADAALATSLARNLGDGFSVDFPPVPDEGEPNFERWRPVIDEAIDRANTPVVPFAHRDLYAAAIPGSTSRTTSGRHQLAEDLRAVAIDIQRTVAG